MKKLAILLMVLFCFTGFLDARQKRAKKPKKKKVKASKKIKVFKKAEPVMYTNDGISSEQIEVLKDIADKLLIIKNAKNGFEKSVAKLKEIKKMQEADLKKESVKKKVKGKMIPQIEQGKREGIEIKYIFQIAELRKAIYDYKKTWLEAQKAFRLID